MGELWAEGGERVVVSCWEESEVGGTTCEWQMVQHLGGSQEVHMALPLHFVSSLLMIFSVYEIFDSQNINSKNWLTLH